MNYEADRGMNQKRLRMDGEPGHGIVQGNGLPLNYMDNGHSGVSPVGYGGYAGYYGEWGGYAGYAPPAHQNYPPAFHHHHPSNIHMQGHMVQPGYDVGKTGWGQVPLVDMKPKEIKLEPQDTLKRTHAEVEPQHGGELDQPKIKIKTDIFKPDDPMHRPEDKQHVPQIPDPTGHIPMEIPNKEMLTTSGVIPEVAIKPPDMNVPEIPPITTEVVPATQTVPHTDNVDKDVKQESQTISDVPPITTTPVKTPILGLEPKKRGRPKGSTNKPKPPPLMSSPTAPPPVRGPPPAAPRPSPVGRPRGVGYQYAVRPFRKDFSGITFRRRWSDECLESSHIPNEVYFGDVPVPLEVLHNYHDTNAEKERLAQQAAHLAAHRAAHARLTLPAQGGRPHEVTTVDSSSDDTSDSDSDSSGSDDEKPLKKKVGRPPGVSTPKSGGGGGTGGTTGTTGGKRGRPPVPPELRTPGIMDMKRFCKLAGIRFDYKKLTQDCTKNKERVGKMEELLRAAGVEGKITDDKCVEVRKQKAAAKVAKVNKVKVNKVKQEDKDKQETDPSGRRVTRGQSGVRPRQKIYISSSEDEDTPAARRTINKIRDTADHDPSSD